MKKIAFAIFFTFYLVFLAIVYIVAIPISFMLAVLCFARYDDINKIEFYEK